MKRATALVGFEESQAVTIELRRKGIEAYSCDILECHSGGHPEWHIQGDAEDAIVSMQWDFVGLHPPCTTMTLSGNKWYGKGKPKHGLRLESVEYTIRVWQKMVKHSRCGYMENPIGAMNRDTRLPRPQIIQPYYFGDEAQKTTCLWLHNLPWLEHWARDSLYGKKTHVGKGDMVTLPSGKKMPKWYSNAPHGKKVNRGGLRSKTFPGIAKAIANQWGSYLIEKQQNQ